MNIHTYMKLMIAGLIAVGVPAYLSVQITDTEQQHLTFIVTTISTLLCLTATFLIAKNYLNEKYEDEIKAITEKHEGIIKDMKREHDTATLEKTIRDGTQTLIKNALDYFKIENIKNELGATAALNNLQLDKYGQIIELLVEFSLILPDRMENQKIVQREIDHQIKIYHVDERPFAIFLHRLMEKYLMSLTKKVKEKVEHAAAETKICPRCAETVSDDSVICKHCNYDFKTAPKTPAHGTIAVDRFEEGRKLYNMGNYQEARDMFSKAIELKEDYAGAYYNRAITCYRLGNMEEYEDDLKEASYLGHRRADEILNSGSIRPDEDDHI